MHEALGGLLVHEEPVRVGNGPGSRPVNLG
jgi:hypothetical protein